MSESALSKTKSKIPGRCRRHERKRSAQSPDPSQRRYKSFAQILCTSRKMGLPPAMLNRLLRLAAFQNPEFYKAQAMRLPTFNKPRVIACGEDLANYIALPRGCIAEVSSNCLKHTASRQ